MRYHAGHLNERVKLQASTVTVDDHGEPAETWADVATVWAAVQLESGSERIRAERLEARQMATIVIRYRSDVSTASRLVHGTRVFEVTATRPLDRYAFLEISCVSAE